MRAANVEYLELWREGQLDVDFVVSSELETAHAISRIIGVPAARQTDVFAEGQVQLVEFDVQEGASTEVLGEPLRDAHHPRDSKVAAIIRGGEMLLPGGDDRIAPGDRIVVIGSPQAALSWGKLLAPEESAVRDVVIYGAGRVGTAIARLLLDRTTRRLRAQGIEVEFTEGAVGLIGEEGFDPEFGARPLRRTIQRRVDNELASMVLSGSLDPGDRVVVGADGEAGGLTFEVVAGAAAAEPPGEGR